MTAHIHRLWEWVKLFVLFIVFTLLGYLLIGLLTDWLKPSYRFEEPEGRAIKVFSHEESLRLLPATDDWERLKLFFWIGE